MSTNRNGDVVSAQVSCMGVITLNAGQNFSLKGRPFQIKNEADSPVTLEVSLKGMAEGEFVTTTFDTGWNPEICREVKTTSAAVDLKWGY